MTAAMLVIGSIGPMAWTLYFIARMLHRAFKR